MESPTSIILRIAQQKQIKPEWMLAYLLKCLGMQHIVRGVHAGKPAAEESTVFNEIMGLMNNTASKQPPKTLLATVDLMVAMHYSTDAHNAQIYKSQEMKDAYPERSKGIDQEAAIGEALRLVLRECMNVYERSGLEQGLQVEQMASKFIGGCIDGEKRLVTTTDKPGSEVAITDPKDSDWADIYILGEDNICRFDRRERKKQ